MKRRTFFGLILGCLGLTRVKREPVHTSIDEFALGLVGNEGPQGPQGLAGPSPWTDQSTCYAEVVTWDQKAFRKVLASSDLAKRSDDQNGRHSAKDAG